MEAAAVTSSDLVQLVSGMRKLLQYAENTGFEGLPSTVESTLERLSPPNNKERQIAEEGLELVVVFRGKSYILSAAGDKLGIISARETR